MVGKDKDKEDVTKYEIPPMLIDLLNKRYEERDKLQKLWDNCGSTADFELVSSSEIHDLLDKMQKNKMKIAHVEQLIGQAVGSQVFTSEYITMTESKNL